MTVRDEDVIPAIIIHIKKRGSPTYVRISGLRHSGIPADVGESLRTQISVKRIWLLSEVGHEEVELAVVVEVSKVDTHRSLFLAVSTESSAGDESHFLKGAVVAVVIKVIWSGVIRNVEIRPAIIVIVSPNSLHSEVMVGIVYPRLL